MGDTQVSRGESHTLLGRGAWDGRSWVWGCPPPAFLCLLHLEGPWLTFTLLTICPSFSLNTETLPFSVPILCRGWVSLEPLISCMLYFSSGKRNEPHMAGNQSMFLSHIGASLSHWCLFLSLSPPLSSSLPFPFLSLLSKSNEKMSSVRIIYKHIHICIIHNIYLYVYI